MSAIFKTIKILILEKVLSFINERWNNQGRIKVLIVTNEYFTETKWETLFKQQDNDVIQNWNIVFCKSRYDAYRHFAAADICFVFGYGSSLGKYNAGRKLLYFPLLGLDFLGSHPVSTNFIVEHPPAYSAIALAEYSVAMTILLSRYLHYSIYNQLNKKWDQYPCLKKPFVSLSDMKIGILGVGNVGSVIASQFKKNRCYIAGFDKTINTSLTAIDKWYGVHELYDFLEAIDVLVISISLTKETRYLIGSEELKKLGPASYLINISRGEIINETALFMALKNNLIKGAVIDTFSTEPLPSTSELYDLDNLIITPHIAGNMNLFVKEIQQDFICKAIEYSKNV